MCAGCFNTYPLLGQRSVPLSYMSPESNSTGMRNGGDGWQAMLPCENAEIGDPHQALSTPFHGPPLTSDPHPARMPATLVITSIVHHSESAIETLDWTSLMYTRTPHLGWLTAKESPPRTSCFQMRRLRWPRSIHHRLCFLRSHPVVVWTPAQSSGSPLLVVCSSF